MSRHHTLLGWAVLLGLTGSAAAQLQFDELVKRQLPPDRDRTFAVALGDVDGDGDPDLVCGHGCCGGWPSARLYVNAGAGVFVAAAAAAMPSRTAATNAIALADVDGDGDLDLVLAGEGDRLYLNDGTGTFADATATHMPAATAYGVDVAVGDVDGDGDLDLLFVAVDANRLYLNNGSGVFVDVTAARMPVATNGISSIAVGDADGDGDLDVVLGKRFSSYQNQLYLNDGNGTFIDATAGRMPVDRDWTEAVAFDDVDGDGDNDLVFGNGLSGGKQNRLYLNDGTGVFTDVTATNLPATSDWTLAVVLQDVDADGDRDLLVGNNQDENYLYLNDGAGKFAKSATAQWPLAYEATYAVASGDVDGDGDADVVFGNVDQINRLYLGDGTGAFVDSTAPRLAPRRDIPFCIAPGDVDGDGDLDLVFGNIPSSSSLGSHVAGDGQNSLYLNDGTGTFVDATAARMPPLDEWTAAVALGDVDGDGDLDLAVGNYSADPMGFLTTGRNRLYLNGGTGTFTDATAANLPRAADVTMAVALGDADGDGDLDAIWGNRQLCNPFGGCTGGQNTLYLNDGSGVFVDATAARLPSDTDNTMAVALGDVDGDGDLDLVLGNDGQQNRLYLNDGSGTFQDVTASRLPPDGDWTADVRLCDVDGDGDSDLVIANGANGRGGQNKLYLNDGTGTFADVTTTHMPVSTRNTGSMDAADVDRDGDIDLVFDSGPSGGRLLLYLNDGTGRFADVTTARMPSTPDPDLSLVLADLDSDGDPDLVHGSWEDSALYSNLLRQLDSPYLVAPGGNYRLEVYSRYGITGDADVAYPILAPATANIPLPPFGTLFLAPSTVVALPPLVIRPQTGVNSVTFTIPNMPGLTGVALYAQALLVQNPAAYLTDFTADVIR